MNLARAVGPALAGLLIARVGVAAVFALNAATFAALAVVLAAWRPPPGDAGDRPERFASALRAGGRYVRHAPVVRRILLRSLLFVVPGSVVWALLALVASQRLGLGPGGYGLLLAALGPERSPAPSPSRPSRPGPRSTGSWCWPAWSMRPPWSWSPWSPTRWWWRPSWSPPARPGWRCWPA